MRAIRWGMIGCGSVTEVKSGPGFQKAERSRLVAVMRRNGKLAEDYARRHGIPKWYDRADALIADPDVDAIYVATPPYAHKDHTVAALQAGKPVYVEKPMALCFADCQDMMRASRDAGAPLFVAYYRRALPRFLKVKEIVESGAIGQPRAVTVALYRQHKPSSSDALDWRVDPAIAGGGHFVDMACHTLDFLDYVLGPIAKARGLATNQERLYAAEDAVASAFEFESGVTGVGLWWFASPVAVDRAEIHGTLGYLEFASFDEAPVRLHRGGGEIKDFPVPHPPHVQQPLIQTVVDELTGLGHCPSTAESAARTTRIMDQILASYYAPKP